MSSPKSTPGHPPSSWTTSKNFGAQVVVALDVDVVVEPGELLQRLERLELLLAARVEVDADVADRGGREGLGGLRTGRERHLVDREGTARDGREPDDAAADQQSLAAATAAAVRGGAGGGW